MKYIKKFENSSETFWIYNYYIRNDNHSYYLFPDKESVENHILDVINEERKNYEDEDYNDSMYFTDVKEALEWCEENFNDIIISYSSVKLEPPYEGSEELNRMKEVRKFNI